MREIKFRALKDDMSNCNFVYGQLVYDAIGIPRISAVDISGEGLKFHTCLHGTEGQYTGLKDKNGKEIYEGDVLKNTEHNFTFKVQWGMENESYAGWAGNWNEKDFVSPLFNAPLENCEVIGNIHENPELLK